MSCCIEKHNSCYFCSLAKFIRYKEIIRLWKQLLLNKSINQPLIFKLYYSLCL